MTLKRSVVSAVVLGAAAFSGSALAGVSGNVGVVSEYMFRGISQGTGAAVQGGIDYAHDSGFYVGLWGSNIDWGPGTVETDVYAGFSGEAGGFSYDFGATYYYYPEEDETGFDPSANTIEGYVKLGFGPVTLGTFYTPKWFGAEDGGGDDISQLYLNLSAGFPLSDSLSLDAAVGYTSLSDELAFGADVTDSFFDYSIGLSKSVTDAVSASFSIVGTDLQDDDPKFLIGATYSFDL